jgi:hypothetical protein
VTTGERKLDAGQQEIGENRLCGRDATLADHLGGRNIGDPVEFSSLSSFERIRIALLTGRFGTFYLERLRSDKVWEGDVSLKAPETPQAA